MNNGYESSRLAPSDSETYLDTCGSETEVNDYGETDYDSDANFPSFISRSVMAIQGKYITPGGRSIGNHAPPTEVPITQFLLFPGQRRAGDYTKVIGNMLQLEKEYSSGLHESSHDLSRDSSSGIESGEAGHSDSSPKNNHKSLQPHLIQHRAMVHAEVHRNMTSQHVHNRDPSWSSQTCSDSDVIHGGSVFSSSDTDNNSRPKTPLAGLDSNGQLNQTLFKSRPDTYNNRTRLKPRALKCKKHVTFQSGLKLNPIIAEKTCSDVAVTNNNHKSSVDGKGENGQFVKESDILYYEDDSVSDQYYSGKVQVYQETDLDNPNETLTVTNSAYTAQSQGKHHYQKESQNGMMNGGYPHPALMSSGIPSRSQTPVANVSANVNQRLSPSVTSNKQSVVSQGTHVRPSKNTDQCHFDNLPDDIVIKIFSNLPSEQVCRCSAVSRRWYDLAWNPTLWTTIEINSPNVNIDKALKFLTRRLSYNTPGVCVLVEKINLNYCEQLTDKGLFSIAKKCAELRHLEIQGCVNVSNIAIFEVVSRCVNLEHLNVTGCEQVTCISLTPQATVQAQTYGKQVDLRYLDMSDCYNLEDSGLQIIVSYCSQLVYLYLRRCYNVTDIGVQYVANYCHELKELSISDCPRITDFGMKELSKLGTNLRYLSVAKCERVSDNGVKYLARYCHRIRYLNVRGCEGVTDESLLALSKHCLRLRSLDIGKCDVTDDGLQILADRCPQLKKLSLKSCDAVTDRGIMYIANKCRLLQQLNIQECNVTVNAYRTVKKACKNCIIEHTNPGFY